MSTYVQKLQKTTIFSYHKTQEIRNGKITPRASCNVSFLDIRNFMSLLELPSTRHKRKLATHQQNHRWQQKPTIRVHTLNLDFSTQVPYDPSLIEQPETHQKKPPEKLPQ